MKRWFAWLSPAPLWQYIPVTLAYCLVITGAAYVAGKLVDGYPAFARAGTYCRAAVPLSLILTAYCTWRRYIRGRAGQRAAERRLSVETRHQGRRRRAWKCLSSGHSGDGRHPGGSQRRPADMRSCHSVTSLPSGS
jgi:hypothetical protein